MKYNIPNVAIWGLCNILLQQLHQIVSQNCGQLSHTLQVKFNSYVTGVIEPNLFFFT